MPVPVRVPVRALVLVLALVLAPVLVRVLSSSSSPSRVDRARVDLARAPVAVQQGGAARLRGPRERWSGARAHDSR